MCQFENRQTRVLFGQTIFCIHSAEEDAASSHSHPFQCPISIPKKAKFSHLQIRLDVNVFHPPIHPSPPSIHPPPPSSPTQFALPSSLPHCLAGAHFRTNRRSFSPPFVVYPPPFLS